MSEGRTLPNAADFRPDVGQRLSTAGERPADRPIAVLWRKRHHIEIATPRHKSHNSGGCCVE